EPASSTQALSPPPGSDQGPCLWPWDAVAQDTRASPADVAGSCASRYQSGLANGRQALQLSKKASQTSAQLGTRNDQINGAMVEQEFASLEAFRELLAYGLLDHARAGEADQRFGFGYDHITKHCQAGRHTTVNRIGENRNERQAFLTHAGQHCRGLGHLHQGNQCFLHPRTAGSRETDQRTALLEGHVGRLYKALTDDGSHGATH